VLVDEALRTSTPDVFAAGDVAQVFDPFSGKSELNSLWLPARDQGRIAGRNMVQGHKHGYSVYLKEAPFNVTRLAGLTTTIIGTVSRGEDMDLLGDRLAISRGDSETWRQLPDAIAAQSCFEINRLRLMIGEKTLLGAVVMGNQTLSLPLQELIARRADISPIRQRLVSGKEPLADLIAEFWCEWKAQYDNLQAAPTSPAT
jgi:NADPH-dependent 2,4-dienoyl-CoA reductase/sulfur reductase-like enzyme